MYLFVYLFIYVFLNLSLFLYVFILFHFFLFILHSIVGADRWYVRKSQRLRRWLVRAGLLNIPGVRRAPCAAVASGARRLRFAGGAVSHAYDQKS